MTDSQLINLSEEFLKGTFGKTFENADTKEVYRALSRAVMADIYGRRNENTKKRVGYLSAEFLIGRTIYANLFNLGKLEGVKAELEKKGLDISMFEDIEDAALGNGGLGRLAACYLESGATAGIPLDGYGIRYRYGLFRQTFENGYQKETADAWLSCGDPWSIRREEESVIVEYADFKVKAVPYDMPVIGYGGKTVNTLRLWQSEEAEGFDFELFDSMKGNSLARNREKAEEISYVLYPNDSTNRGRLLRLRQEYFFTSASVADIMRRLKREGKSLENIEDYISLQLNDTHPVLAVPEFIRKYMAETGADFETAFVKAKKVFNFTNHTILGEALECWDMKTVRRLLPRIADILRLMQKRAEKEFKDSNLYLIDGGGRVHMADVAIYCGGHINGVAKLHTEILKESTFKDWYKVFPERFLNVTNGITPRRWLALCNKELSSLVTGYIGEGWETDLERLKGLEKFLYDGVFRERFVKIKQEKKRQLSLYIEKKEGIKIPENFVFDVQVKRLHEYKRQLMNALSIMYIYNGLKDGSIKSIKPVAFIFGAKAAPSYYIAKAVIKYINCIADLVNNDPDMQDKMKVVFVTDYNVSYAEKIIPAADISEQISLAGTEASGTGNMKLMLNGGVTLGTMDGANIEICEEAGRENEYIFGADVKEVKKVREAGYAPRDIYINNEGLKRAVDSLDDGTFDDKKGMLKDLKASLFGGWSADHYFVLYDFADYLKTKLKIINDCGTYDFISKMIINTANAGKFSSDRAIKEYARKVWNV